jgi:hypothetical protein
MPTDQLGQPASRRSVLKGAAGIGAAGIAATALTSVAGPALAAAKNPGHEAGHEAGRETGHQADHDGEQVVVHVRDASLGHLELYSGTSQVHLRDKDLAERIVRASRKQVR